MPVPPVGVWLGICCLAVGQADWPGGGPAFATQSGNAVATGLGNLIAGGWYFEYPRLVHRVPAAGTSSARGWYIEYPRLVLRFPRAGNIIPKGWEHYSQGLGTLFPAAGSSIPSGWESSSQGRGNFGERCEASCKKACGQILGLEGMAESHPKPDEGGFACSPGQATEGNDTPGRAAGALHAL